MYSREQIEQHIWDYIDGTSTPAMKEMVESLLHTDPEWNRVYLELKDFNSLVSTTDFIETPSMRFSKNVMEEVAKYKVAPPTSHCCYIGCRYFPDRFLPAWQQLPSTSGS
jgi:anti-sigma factor RsiW